MVYCDFAERNLRSEFPFPGCTPVVSANGNTNGIIWAVDASTYGNAGRHSVLRCCMLTKRERLSPLWTSSETGNDTAGNAVKFAVPTIANGKVYLGTQTELDVYGTHP